MSSRDTVVLDARERDAVVDGLQRAVSTLEQVREEGGDTAQCSFDRYFFLSALYPLHFILCAS